MRRTLAVTLLLLGIVGCGKKSVPTAAVVVPQTNARPAGFGAGVADDPANPVYQGRTAEQWAPLLQERNSTLAQRQQAGAALSRMGEKGAGELLKGMRSTSPEVRLASVQATTRTQLLQRKTESMALMMTLANDPQPDIRTAAVSRLAWFEKDSANALPLLQRVAKEDSDLAVRSAATDALGVIGELQKGGGKITRGVLPSNPPKK